MRKFVGLIVCLFFVGVLATPLGCKREEKIPVPEEKLIMLAMQASPFFIAAVPLLLCSHADETAQGEQAIGEQEEETTPSEEEEEPEEESDWNEDFEPDPEENDVVLR